MRRRPVAIVVAGALLALTAGAAWALSEREPEVPAAVAATTPTSEELATFAGTRIFFGHQSVGSNIIAGTESLFSGNEDLTVVETREEVPAEGGFLVHAHVGVNGDPFGKFDDFASIIDGPMGSSVDVALIKLCYVDVTASTDVQAVFEAYTELMTRLEAEHADVTFVYTTVPLTTDRGWKQTVKAWLGRDDQMGPADNVARQQYNELIRERYGDTGRLFDIAAVESTMDDDPTLRSLDGQSYYVLHGGLAADPGHLNDPGSRVAATELIRVIAAQAG